MTAHELYREASLRGLRLESRGDKLAVIPANRCTPDFAELLRHHKLELLALLEGNPACRAPGCGPWLHIARQVVAGEFHGANRSTLESLRIGLRSIEYPLCRQALEVLNARRGF